MSKVRVAHAPQAAPKRSYGPLPLCDEPGCAERVYHSGRQKCAAHKGLRRQADEMATIREALYYFAEGANPIGVRQAFYQMVGLGLVPKTDAGVRTVNRLLILMRRDGSLPYHWIEDGTRWMHKPTSFDSIEAAVKNAAASYRKALWAEADIYVEVWVEKRGLITTIYPVTEEWDVPLMPAAGFSSISFLYSAAMDILEADRPAFIYYLGDLDKAGLDAFAFAEREIREHAPDADLTFEWLAVTEEQVDEWGLPGPPPKPRDTRAGLSRVVELDAIHPDQLRQLVRDALESHLPEEAVAAERATEKAERAVWAEFMASFPKRAA